jgi:GTP-binding protein
VVSADSEDIVKEYKVLLKELKLYNPELLSKKRILAISKSDLIDEELELMLSKDINKRLKGVAKIPYLFFSAHSEKNLLKLKDMLWEQLNSQS